MSSNRKYSFILLASIIFFTINSPVKSNDNEFIKRLLKKEKNINTATLFELKRLFSLVGMSYKDAETLHRYIHVVNPVTNNKQLCHISNFNKKKCAIVNEYFFIGPYQIHLGITFLKKSYLKYIIDYKIKKETRYRRGEKIGLNAFESIQIVMGKGGKIRLDINGKSVILDSKNRVITKEIVCEIKNSKPIIRIIDWYGNR